MRYFRWLLQYNKAAIALFTLVLVGTVLACIETHWLWCILISSTIDGVIAVGTYEQYRNEV